MSQKTWTELLGQPQYGDAIYRDEIVRPTECFTITDFGKKRMIWKTLWKFDSDSKAKEVFDIWQKENA